MKDTRDIDWKQAYIDSVNRHNETLDELRTMDAEVWRLRGLVENTQDWSEIKALRESLREHMAEIHRLRAAGWQALDALEIAMKTPINEYLPREPLDAITALRATLSWDAMQRLTDVQQKMEQPVKNCHDLEQARDVAISNLLTHFGITSVNSDVNSAYLHKILDDFLIAAIGCNKEGDKLAPPLKIDECEYPNCLATTGCEKQCPAFPRISDGDTGKTSDHIPDATKMMASVREDRTVEPVGYFSINSYGNWEQNESGYGTPLYEAPPKRQPLSAEEIESLADEFLDWNSAGIESFARAIERAHGIGGRQ